MYKQGRINWNWEKCQLPQFSQCRIRWGCLAGDGDLNSCSVWTRGQGGKKIRSGKYWVLNTESECGKGTLKYLQSHKKISAEAPENLCPRPRLKRTRTRNEGAQERSWLAPRTQVLDCSSLPSKTAAYYVPGLQGGQLSPVRPYMVRAGKVTHRGF